MPWGSDVFAIVSATNDYGTLSFSSPGNGAVILTEPDAPANLQELKTNKSPTTIGLKWTEGAYDGGRPVLDYTLFWDEGFPTGVFKILGLNITTQTFLASNLTNGTTYRF